MPDTFPSRTPDAGYSLPLTVATLGLLALAAGVLPELLRGHGQLQLGALQGLALGAGVVLMAGAGVLVSPRAARVRAQWIVTIAERDTSLADVRALAVIAVQLVSVMLLAYAFRIESPVFYGRIFPMTVIGFVVHHFAPRPLRIWLFAFLSLGSFGLVFGFREGAWLLAMGALLIAAAHAPVAYRWRVSLVVAIGVGLGFARAGVIAVPWSPALWPVLASMFMFRLVAYLYDLRHQKEPVHWARTVSYFFLLPNVAFPLFPVVDFSTFRRTYYDRPAMQIYQQGVEWMVRGILQLLLYRLVYQFGVISPAEVNGTAALVRYVVANFGLYLRVSGQFHLIVGMLHLFGFRLPETHRFFFLASSFTDFWRRINIYWKDFMMKVVFYPVHFGVRKWGETTSLVVATVCVFFVTWATHSYQWFWLLGTWLFSATDALFWGILAVLLVFNSVRELRRGRERSLRPLAPTGWNAVRLGMHSAATFAVISVLWSLWTSPTLAAWISMMRTVTFGPRDFLAVGLVLGVVGVVAVLAARLPRERRLGPVGVLASALAPVFLVATANRQPLADWLPVATREVIRDVRTGELSRRDAEQMQRGYYENITGVNRFNTQLWNVYSKKSRNSWQRLDELGAMTVSKSRLVYELKPLQSVLYHGAALRTNRWGMRDRDYPKALPPNTDRIAVLGQSYVLGDGVADDETFEALLERKLNADSSLAAGRRKELLNFAVLAYSPFQQLVILENGRVAEFSPQVMLLFGNPLDVMRDVEYLIIQRQQGREIPWAPMSSLLDSLGVRQTSSWDDAQRLMQPVKERVTRWALGAIRQQSLRQGMRPVYILLDTPNMRTLPEVLQMNLRLAREAGFEVLDLSDVYEGVPGPSLWVAEWDRHPNSLGHQLISERLFKEIKGRPSLIYPGDSLPLAAKHEPSAH